MGVYSDGEEDEQGPHHPVGNPLPVLLWGDQACAENAKGQQQMILLTRD